MSAIFFHTCICCRRPKPPNGIACCDRCKAAGIRNRNGAHITSINVMRYRLIRKEKQP